MKRSILIFLSCIALPAYAAVFSAHVPKGWKIIKSVEGDLNGDNQADAVLVLQKQDKANIIPNDSMGLPELDTNPRMLKALFKQADGYKTVVENTTLIPPESDKDNGCLDDPFSDVSIDKGRLKVVDGDFRRPLFSSLQCRADSNKTPPSRHTHAWE